MADKSKEEKGLGVRCLQAKSSPARGEVTANDWANNVRLLEKHDISKQRLLYLLAYVMAENEYKNKEFKEALLAPWAVKVIKDKTMLEEFLGSHSNKGNLVAKAILPLVQKERKNSKAHSVSGSNKRPRTKVVDGVEFSESFIIAKLAKCKDVIGDPLSSQDLWDKLIGLLDDKHLEPKEVRGKKQFWSVSYLIDDNDNQRRLEYSKFKIMLSKARKVLT
jgi:hypothetical protein